MNNNSMQKPRSQHAVSVKERAEIMLTGIEEVLSFDDSAIIMQSTMGQLTLDGCDLNIVKLNLDEGEVVVSGKLNGFFYMEQKKSGGSFFSRIFG